MARLFGVAINSAEIACSASTAKTVLQLVAPANQQVAIIGVGFFFDGVDVSGEPVVVELIEQSDAGTSSALTPQKIHRANGTTLQTTAREDATAEPTGSVVLDAWEIHPQAGYEAAVPLFQEIILAGGGRAGIRVTAPAAVNCRAKVKFEE